MAELILTEEEKAAALWSDLDDAALGKLVKKKIALLTSAAEQLDRVTTFAAAMLLLTTIEGQLVTPQLLGRQLRLNPVAVLVWMMAWGWMWGLAGLLLAVPMLVCLKTVCEHVTACRWLALILEDGPRISQGRSHHSVQDATDASPQAID